MTDNVIHYPFNIQYKQIASLISNEGVEKAKHLLMLDFSEKVSSIIIRKALSKGWGS